jgi:hypothetical protein
MIRSIRINIVSDNAGLFSLICVKIGRYFPSGGVTMNVKISLGLKYNYLSYGMLLINEVKDFRSDLWVTSFRLVMSEMVTVNSHRKQIL